MKGDVLRNEKGKVAGRKDIGISGRSKTTSNFLPQAPAAPAAASGGVADRDKRYIEEGGCGKKVRGAVGPSAENYDFESPQIAHLRWAF